MPERPILESPRLILRAFAMSDVESLTLLANDENIARSTLSIPHPYEERHAREWIASQQTDERGQNVTFAIVLKEGSQLCGSIGVRIDNVNARAEIGFWVGRPFWNRGLCSEAASMLLEYAFNTLDVNRVYAFHFVDNEASGRVMRRIGMRHEGLLRQHMKKGDEFLDLEAYGILREEFLDLDDGKKVSLMTIALEKPPGFEITKAIPSRRGAAVRGVGEGGPRRMAIYGKKAQDKVEKTMHERKHGTLRSGSGKKVTSRKQAIAIGLSEARREGGKVPAKKSSAKTASAKKSAAKKSVAKKPASKRK
ncbi:MAG TPA: GNAT family N-acetyltransferase [Thermoanaerobaculia bacterium]|nr:GNAT family N-acetyltransferase [Thermoanaerobaculia bacterium]